MTVFRVMQRPPKHKLSVPGPFTTLVSLPCTPLPELNPVLQMSHDGVGTLTWTQPSAHTGWVWASCRISCNKLLAEMSPACGHLPLRTECFWKHVCGKNGTVLELEDQRPQVQGSLSEATFQKVAGLGLRELGTLICKLQKLQVSLWFRSVLVGRKFLKASLKKLKRNFKSFL